MNYEDLDLSNIINLTQLFYTFLSLNGQFFEESFAVILIVWLDRR